MAILFVGTEDTDFNNIGSFSDYNSGSASFASRTNLVRSALWVGNNTPETKAWIATPVLTTTANPIWLGAYHGYTSIAQGGTYLQFRSGANIVAEFRANANNSVSLYLRNSSGFMTWVAETAPRVYDYAGGGAAEYFYKYDYMIDLAASGNVRMYHGGKAVLNYTGNTLGDLAAGTRINQIYFGNANTVGSGRLLWSEIIMATTDTRTMSVASLPPTSFSANQWSGTVSDINEVTANTTTAITSVTADQVANMQFRAVPPALANQEILMLKVSGLYSRNGTAPNTIAVGLIDGVELITAYTTPFTPAIGSFDMQSNYFDMNYISNAKWTAASLASLHVSLKSG